MSSDEATKLVFVAAAVEVAVVLAAARRGEEVDEEQVFRSLWAVGGLTIGLSMLADFAPQLAGPFALLVAVAMVARNPGQLGSWLGFGPGSAGSPAPLGPRPEEGSRGVGGRLHVPPSRSPVRVGSNGRGGV